MKYIIAGNTNRSGLFYQCGDDVVVIEKNIFNRHKFTCEDKLYIACEEGLELVLNHSENIRHLNAISTLKDKYAARKEIKNVYPDFFFKKTTLDELPNETFNFDKIKKYIVKPLRGFFGTGVKEITADTDLSSVSREIRSELERNIRFFSESVISKEELIIEEFIEGEEYAVDMFYDSEGEPIIINILQHPKAKYKAYDNVLYYTNEKIFNRLYEKTINFFYQLSPEPAITSFPIHAEFKFTPDKKLIPVELNPFRFGGYGLADLIYYAFKINPFYLYFNDIPLDWKDIWRENKNMTFGFVLAYNGTKADIVNKSPDDQKLKDFLGNALIKYVPIDHLENPVFAVCYVKSKENELWEDLLKIDFNDYFI